MDRDHLPRWLVALQLLGAGVWLALVTWKLSLVPGMSMDEAWSILSARGQLLPTNPLSGMSSYAGAFPVMVLELFGRGSGLLVLRGASVLANAIALALIGRMLQQLYGRRVLAGWALPLIATSPTWLISTRTGIEVTMFTPLLVVLGLYFTTRVAGVWTFAAGVTWGLLVYNHLLGLWLALAFVVAWLVVYRRARPIAWGMLLGGFAVGIAPRLIAVALYDNTQITSTALALSPGGTLADLLSLPRWLWELLLAQPIYLRYVGRVAEQVLPYSLLSIVMVMPWLWHWRRIPRPVLFTLVAWSSCCVLTTLGTPYLEVRFLVLPAIGFPVVLVMLGAAAVELDSRWGHAVRAAAGLLVIANSYYVLTNFYLPWQRRELKIGAYHLGQRGRPVGSWHFLPKDELARELSSLEPRPAQVVSLLSITQPLQVLMDGTGIRIVDVEHANKQPGSVFINYRNARNPPRYCTPVASGKMCFAQPTIVDHHFVLYRSGR